MSKPDRRTYLGSGDVAAVCGLSPYSTPLDVYAAKVGLVPGKAPTDVMRVGIALERPILESLYAEPRGYVLEYPGWVGGPLDWMGATVDAMVVGQSRAAECKVVGLRMAGRWDDGVPADVLVQVQWQMMCCKLDVCDVAALIGTEFRVAEVARDDEMIGNLRVVAERFWRDHVTAGIAPEITEANAAESRDLLARMYPRQSGPTLALMTADVRELAARYIAARDAEKAATAEKDAVAALIQAAVGASAGYTGDGYKVTWLAPEGGGTPRWKDIALAAGASQELIAAHTNEHASRRLDVRAIKGGK